VVALLYSRTLVGPPGTILGNQCLTHPRSSLPHDAIKYRVNSSASQSFVWFIHLLQYNLLPTGHDSFYFTSVDSSITDFLLSITIISTIIFDTSTLYFTHFTYCIISTIMQPEPTLRVPLKGRGRQCHIFFYIISYQYHGQKMIYYQVYIIIFKMI
jgi:hypothetical protein